MRKPSTFPRNLLECHDQVKLLNTLSDSKRLDFEKFDFPLAERANIFSLWYAEQLLKL